MKFLADQDLYDVTIKFLKDLGHDVITAAQLGMSRSKDLQLLRTAHEQGRIFVTRDRDFGALVFVQASGPEFARVLTLYSEQQLQSSFVVIEPGRHRIRKV